MCRRCTASPRARNGPGVLLSTLLEEAGIDPKAKWIIAEGADSPHLTRSVPLAKAMDDAMVAMYQNGERIQPGQGYPMRLWLPGYEGNMNVKFLRRIQVTDQPALTYYEARTYSQILPNGKAYRFYFLQEVKSFISSPSPGLKLKEPGIYEISGVAYAGTGRIAKVMVSADGGKSWAEAALQEPRLPKAFTRFRMPWRWDGGPAILQSRAWDEAGNMQPTREQFVALRGQTTKPPSVLGFPSQHFNAITSWAVDAQGGGQTCLCVSSRSAPRSSRAGVCRRRHGARRGAQSRQADHPGRSRAVGHQHLPDGTNLPPGSGKAAHGARSTPTNARCVMATTAKAASPANSIGGPPKA